MKKLKFAFPHVVSIDELSLKPKKTPFQMASHLKGCCENLGFIFKRSPKPVVRHD